MIEATGAPSAGVDHALAAIERGRHVVMVNVEADILAGPVLAERARRAGVVYSLAYGDQPALDLRAGRLGASERLRCRLRRQGHEVPARVPRGDARHRVGSLRAERRPGGCRRLQRPHVHVVPRRHQVGDRDGRGEQRHRPESRRRAGCGSRRAGPAASPRCSSRRPPGASCRTGGTVEVVSSLERDGTPIADDLRWGVYVTFAAGSDFVARCFRDYGIATDASGEYAALYRPSHLIGLETSVSVLAAGLLRRADRGADGIPRRRVRRRQARPGARRDPGRRGRVHRCGQAPHRRGIDRDERTADRPRARPAAGAARSRPAPSSRWRRRRTVSKRRPGNAGR